AIQMGHFHRLVDTGYSLVMIEHNLGVIKCAYWIIDLGPEAGAEGGQLVAAATPEKMATIDASHTGRYLGRVLGSARASRAVRGASPRTSSSAYIDDYEEMTLRAAEAPFGDAPD